MLYLSRLKGESILIGDEIEVLVANIARGVVRLGIDAPPAAAIDRSEVRIKRMTNPDDPRGADYVITATGRVVRRPRCIVAGCKQQPAAAVESVYCSDHSVELANRVLATLLQEASGTC